MTGGDSAVRTPPDLGVKYPSFPRGKKRTINVLKGSNLGGVKQAKCGVRLIFAAVDP